MFTTLAEKNRKQKNRNDLRPQPAKPRNDESIEGLIADLESGKQTSIMIALTKLKQRPAEPNPKVAKAIESAMSNDNKVIQYLAAAAMETWATPENVPLLIEKVNSDQTELLICRSCILALAKLKSPAGIDSIAKQLESRRMRNYATRALQQLGPLAEKAVLEKLQSKDWQVRLAICQILEQSGTKESLVPLQTIQQTDANVLVKTRAGRALELIQTRLAEENKKQ